MMKKTFSFEEAVQASPIDAALQAEGVTGQTADIARSIYQQESGSGKNTKTSNAGAVGGMQVLPSTFKSVADDGWDINDPVHNARAGVRYVKQMSELAGGDPALTAAGYYGGPGGLEKARKGVAVSDPRNPGAPNTLEYGQQVAKRVPKGTVARVMDKVTDAIIPAANAQDVTADKAAPATFSFEEAIATPSGTASAAKAKELPTNTRTFIDQLGHQLGLTVRAGVNGAAAIPAMVSDAVTGPVNAGLDAVSGKGNGFRFQSAGKSLDSLMTAAGVAVPENAQERVVQDAASAVAGAGSMIKGGLGLAKYASGPVSKAVGETLAAGPGLQLTSAATGAGSSGVVRESGGGAGAQLAAGLAGSLAPGFVPAAAKAGVRGALRGGEVGRQQVEKNIAVFENASGDMPTLGQATESRFSRGMESLLSKSPGGAGVMVRKAEDQLQAMSKSVQTISDELAPGASAVNAGEAISKGVKGFKDGFKGIQQRLYNTLDKHIPEGTPIQVGNTEFKLKELNEGIEGAPNISQFFMNSKIKGIDKALQADLELSVTGGSLPYEAVKKLRTLVGNEIADNSLLADVPRSKWTALYGALSDDLGVAAKAAGPKAEQSWQWANQFTKKQLSRLEDLSGIVAKDTPEQVFAKATAGTAEGDTVVKRVISALPKQARREVAAAMLQRMGRATPGVQDATGGAFSSETFLTNLSKLSPAARETIFARTGSDGLLDKVMSMGKMAENIRQGSKVFANPSGTAQALTLKDMVYAAVGGLLTGSPVATVAAIGIPSLSNIAARATTTPFIVKLAAGKTAIPSGAKAAAVGSTTRMGNVTPPPAPETFSFEEAMVTDQGQPAVETPTRIDPNGMAQPALTTDPAQQPAQEPTGQDVQPGAWSGPAADPAPVFATQARADGTLAVTGDRQALREMLTAAGVPVRSMVPINGGMLIGRSQAAMVQEAIERMNAVATDPDAGEASLDDQEATPSDGADLGIAEGGPIVTDSRQAAPDSAVSVTENPVLDIQNADIVAENAPLEEQAPIDIAAHGAATSPQNDLPEPTPGQQQAGNYKLGHDRIAGMDISIENPQGSVRRGVDPDGKPWETQMQHHYGYFRRTSANDGDKLDVFVKPGTPRDYSGPVYVIDQVDPRTGKLDEHKTILGAKDETEAKEIYRSNYAADWRGMGSITRLPLPVFKAWAASGDKKHPLGDLQGEQAQEPPIQVAASADQAGQDVFAQAQEPALEAQPPQSAPVDRIQALRDAGENKVADMLQRKQVTNVAQTELASMQAATPELQHHASPAFSQHYQQRRLAGMKPAEASAHAGMLAAVQTAAPQIGMPDSAVKALASRLQDVPIEDAPGFIERFTQALIKRGIVQPFEGSNQIASMAEQARDLAMNGALNGLYGDNPATTYS